MLDRRDQEPGVPRMRGSQRPQRDQERPAAKPLPAPSPMTWRASCKQGHVLERIATDQQIGTERLRAGLPSCHPMRLIELTLCVQCGGFEFVANWVK